MSAFDEASNWVVLQPDVWGSEQEGWTVNTAYSTNKVIRLDDFESDEEVVRALQSIGLIANDINVGQVDIDGDEDMIYINDAATWEPLYHLQRIERPMVAVH